MPGVRTARSEFVAHRVEGMLQYDPSYVSTMSLAGKSTPILLRFRFLFGNSPEFRIQLVLLEANNTSCERYSGDFADQ